MYALAGGMYVVPLNRIGKLTYFTSEFGHLRPIMKAAMGRIAPTRKKKVRPLKGSNKKDVRRVQPKVRLTSRPALWRIDGLDR